MASRHDTMMNPPIEGLLDRAGSKFTLVTLGAKRARQINSYYNQLSEGLGTVVPPQVQSTARKPLSIAFEEIDADKILGYWPEPEAEGDDDTAEDAEPAEWGPLDEAPAMLEGKRIVLGVSGGIAAYKAVDVCRRLVDGGAHVIPVLTDGALHFVGRTTFDALGSEPAWTSLWDEGRHPIPHTHLGQTADLVLVAPATARVLGLYASGISDDLLTNVLLATRAPVAVCPAMHTEMWEHAAVQDNLRLLRRRGVHVVDPEVGRLAGGDVGTGRLAEPAAIVAAAERILAGEPMPPRDLEGLTVLVTAGGTREAIDPVRVITNRSSGKQGYAVAEEALARGAKVILVTTVDRPISDAVEVVTVSSAADMQAAVVPRASGCDVIVMAAAVADFRPAQVADHKIKKGEGLEQIVLEPTHDFLVDLGRDKPLGQLLVGFAAETSDLEANAADKLARKGLDLIVANDVSAPGVGFEHDTNAVKILGANGSTVDVPLSDKRAIARAILDAVSTTRSNP